LVLIAICNIFITFASKPPKEIKYMDFLLADKQDITRAGLMYIIEQIGSYAKIYVKDKSELLEKLPKSPESIVILDYTLFNINDISELNILCDRFSQTHWIIFCEDLSVEFLKIVVISNPKISVITKDCPIEEIKETILLALKGQRYICQQVTELLLTANNKKEEETIKLTKTETEILKDIALGMTTKEIANKRFSSFHTVNTHRKNIFRKLNINNVHEATKYALRAGLIDSAEYYI
jgi:DNA-binding NarL/FixJ family response regulator